MDLTVVERRLAELGEPGYRARQVWEWTARGAESYDAMTNLPRSVRDTLTDDVPFSTLTAETDQRSRDGTVKTLFRTHDGHPVEAVSMRYRDGRRSVCVSSQSGCPLTCTFCATGRMAFGRNLTPWEIVDQVLHFRRAERVDHVVFMGMGEPFMNVENVLAAARRLPDTGVTHRRTTISTVGWVPGLTRFVEDVTEPIRLALSLHAADPRLRSELMPVNERYPSEEVLALCRAHWERTNRRVYVEYVMLAGVNDAPAQAKALAALLGREAFKVNLIPYNPTGNDHKGHPLRGRPVTPSRPSKAELDRGANPGHCSADQRPRHRRSVRTASHLPTPKVSSRRPLDSPCESRSACRNHRQPALGWSRRSDRRVAPRPVQRPPTRRQVPPQLEGAGFRHHGGERHHVPDHPRLGGNVTTRDADCVPSRAAP